MVHYLAPGKKNLVYHLDKVHVGLVHTAKELNKWTLDELINTHRELHEPHAESKSKRPAVSSTGKAS